MKKPHETPHRESKLTKKEERTPKLEKPTYKVVAASSRCPAQLFVGKPTTSGVEEMAPKQICWL